MKRLSKATLSELSTVFEKAIEEAYQAGLEDGGVVDVDEPETIEHDGLVLQKVDRESKTGDFVRFSGLNAKFTRNHKLYPVIKNDRYIGENEDIWPVYGWKKTCPNPEIFEVVVDETPLQDGPPWAPISAEPIKSKNQQRAELIQRAREFIEDQKKPIKGRNLTEGEDYGKVMSFDGVYVCGLERRTKAVCNAEFIQKNNRITCLLKGTNTEHVYAVGRANCNPTDVFNADIGKAIALCRALEIEIPIEFMVAVQPEDWAVGQIVTISKDSDYHMIKNYRVDSVLEEHDNLTKLFSDGSKASADLTDGKIHLLPIIDDTNAEYGEPL